MNAITSNIGDEWKIEYPLCISGHIHDYDELQSNLLYIGTPIEHSFGKSEGLSQTISMFTFSEQKPIHHRIPLDIPLKLTIHLTPEQLSIYQPPKNTRVKIKVTADQSTIHSLMKLEHVKRLLALGVKIKTTLCDSKFVPKEISKISFQQRLFDTIHSNSPEIRRLFRELFES